MNEHTDGNTVVLKATRDIVDQIREGAVIKSARELEHKVYGRKIAKSISEHYLLRKSNHATEYQ
jgi:hypothetical protein